MEFGGPPPPGTSAADWVPAFCATCVLWLHTGDLARHLRGPCHLRRLRRARRAARVLQQLAEQEQQEEKRER